MIGRRVVRAARRARHFAARAVRGIQDRTVGRWFYMRLPLDPSLVAYTALWHRAPRGNPLAIFRKQLELAPHLRGVWIVRKQDLHLMPEGIDYVTPRTLAYLRLIATATVFVDDANPHWSLPAREGQRYVQTHHGTALKYMGADRHYSGKRPSDATVVTMHRRSQRWTHSLSTSPYLTEVWQRAYQNECLQLEVGFPRNDRLIAATDTDRAAARAKLGLEPHEIAVLYMPTWRTRRRPREEDFDLDDFAGSLPPGHRLLVRDHYYHDRRGRSGMPDQVLDVSTGWEVEELYLASDLLLTDYSSAMFDYALLDKPIVLLCEDWDDYRWSRGAYFDITADAPGPVAMTASELVGVIASREYASPTHERRRASFRERFATYEDGRASETVVRVVLLGEDAARFTNRGRHESRPAGWTTHPPVSHPEDPSIEERLAPIGMPRPSPAIATPALQVEEDDEPSAPSAPSVASAPSPGLN
ncbi:CDP-glycerol glycerophosphotransferase family protein [Demequina sp. SO4-13]|uniref:CDP-glycerol glycerophosphotransferase family protein n=1 Tax=Demequina sp. SO4-13 TaxID=3401027 RepID=UPI003AF68790